MRFFAGLVVGIVIALLIGVGAMAFAVGNIGDATMMKVGDHLRDRDRSDDISKTYDLKDFDKIEIAGVYELDVKVGGDFSVELSGSPEEMDLVKASVDDGELILDRREHHSRWNDNQEHGVTAVITMPALNAVKVSGVVDGDIEGIAADDFKTSISGVGDLDLKGSCGHFDARVSGVGHLKAEDFKCKDVDVRVSGVGNASVYASERVSAYVSGMGEIDVSGSPKEVEKSGGLFSSIHVK